MNNNRLIFLLATLLVLASIPAVATKVIGLRVIDKNYLMLHLRDGEVHYRDSGEGPSAYLGHSFSEEMTRSWYSASGSRPTMRRRPPSGG